MTGVLFFAGLLLIATPGGTVLLAWWAWRWQRRLGSTIPVLTCEQLARAEVLPRWVALTARTGAPGAAALRAPRSGAECVWYQMEYAHSPNHDERLQRRVDFAAGAELVVVGDGSGTVFLTPELARTKMAGPAIATITGGGRDGDVGWQEVIIPADVAVFVIGRPTRVAELGPIRTVIVEKGPGFLPDMGFPMGTGHLSSAARDGIVLRSGWRSPQGVSTLPAEEVRRAASVRLKWMIVLLLGLPAVGIGLIALASAAA